MYLKCFYAKDGSGRVLTSEFMKIINTILDKLEAPRQFEDLIALLKIEIDEKYIFSETFFLSDFNTAVKWIILESGGIDTFNKINWKKNDNVEKG